MGNQMDITIRMSLNDVISLGSLREFKRAERPPNPPCGLIIVSGFCSAVQSANPIGITPAASESKMNGVSRIHDARFSDFKITTLIS